MDARARARRAQPVYGWSWKILDRGRWVLCHFMFEKKAILLFDGKPSPEAVAVRVRMSLARRRVGAKAKQ